MTTDRRSVISGALAGGAMLAAGCAAGRDGAPASADGGDREALPPPDIYLWPEGAPGHAPTNVKADDRYHVDNPGLFVFPAERPNGAAILLFQGGGYQLVGRRPGVPRYFAQKGYTVFDLRYRLPHAGWEAGPDVMLQDAQRAMRIVRSRAEEFGFDPAKVGVMGYSSGGHMATFFATSYAREMAPVGSGLLDVPVRPAWVCAGCPVVTMQGPHAHRGSVRNMFGDARDPDELALRSPELHVTAETPPMFLVHAADDRVVPVENSLMLFEALMAHGVPVELQVFEKGGHSMGAGFSSGSPLSPFPDLMANFMDRRIASA